MSREAPSPAAGDGRDLARRVVNVVVQGIMSSKAGLRIDRGRLLQVVEDRLPDLLDGTRLRFDPVLRALLRVDGVTEADLYLGIVNLSIQLAQMGIELEPPDLDLDHATRLELLAAAQSGAERSREALEDDEVRRRIRRLRGRKLGDLLVEEGLISGAQLAEALAAQRRVGGRIGTNLVEQGHLSEIELAHFLSVQLGVPSVTRLDQISADARDVLAPEVAERHRVVPTRVDGDEIHLAMADPLDLEAIDAVVEATGRPVFPVVAPELLISYALERSYGVPRAPRVLGPVRPAAVPDESDEAPREVDVDLGHTEDMPTLDLPAAGAQLARVETDAQIFALVQAFLEQRSGVSGVFVVEGDKLRGWSHRGALITQAAFRDAAFVYANHPVLRDVASSAAPYVGPGSAREGSQWLTETLGLVPEARIVALPLHRRGALAGVAVAVLDDGREADIDARFLRMVSAALDVVALRHHILDEAS